MSQSSGCERTSLGTDSRTDELCYLTLTSKTLWLREMERKRESQSEREIERWKEESEMEVMEKGGGGRDREKRFEKRLIPIRQVEIGHEGVYRLHSVWGELVWVQRAIGKAARY